MSASLEEQFLELYVATVVGLACGTRAIVEAMNKVLRHDDIL
jgi:ribulose kinase